jgi:hypothetical protein
MLDDPLVHAAFERTLLALRTSIERGDLLDHLRRVEAMALRQLHSEYLFLEAMDLDLFARRVQSLPVARDQASPPTPYPVHVLAEVVRVGPRHYLEIANPLPVEVTVSAIEWVRSRQRVRCRARWSSHRRPSTRDRRPCSSPTGRTRQRPTDGCASRPPWPEAAK